MNTGRHRRIVMVVAMGLLSIPLTLWVVSRSPSGSVPLTGTGEDVHVDVTRPLALEEGPQALPIETPEEYTAAMPERPAAEGTPPLMIPAVQPVEQPQAAPARPPDVVPARGPMAAELATRARGALQQLDSAEDGAGSPMERATALFTFLEQRQCGGTCRAAQGATEAYLRARVALLRTMLEAFLASDGEYDGVDEQQALQDLHAAFTAEMATLGAHVPMLARLPDVLATTLRVPDYLAAPADAPRARQ